MHVSIRMDDPDRDLLEDPVRPAVSVARMLCLLVILVTSVEARQDVNPDPVRWEDGPRAVSIAGVARLQVPAGDRWAGPSEARRLMDLIGNPDQDPSGVLVHEADDASFLLAFRFVADGYVPDDEKDRLDRAALLAAIRDATGRDNATRRQRGWPIIEDVEWDSPPAYDPVTNDLSWTLRFNSSGVPAMNRDTRRLGRGGIMQVKLIATADQLTGALPGATGLMDGFAFEPGQQYSDHAAGDLVAPYGLALLVAGPTAAFAASKGWLGNSSPPANRQDQKIPSRAANPAYTPFRKPSRVGIAAGPGNGTNLSSPRLGNRFGSPGKGLLPGAGMAPRISTNPMLDGRTVPLPAARGFRGTPMPRSGPASIPAPALANAEKKGASSLGRWLLAAIGGAVLGAFSRFKKLFVGVREGVSGSG